MRCSGWTFLSGSIKKSNIALRGPLWERVQIKHVDSESLRHNTDDGNADYVHKKSSFDLITNINITN